MCLIANDEDRMIELREPLIVYKVMLGFNKKPPGQKPEYMLKTPYMNYGLQLGEKAQTTMSTKKFRAFIAGRICGTSYHGQYNITEGAYHSFPSIGECRPAWAYFYRRYVVYGTNELPLIVRCVIPAWSGIVKGVNDDSMPCIASNRITLMEIIPIPDEFKK